MNFSVLDADNYGGQGGGGYFRLKNDHDTAQVRFLYDSIDDVQGYAVHEIQVGDKKRYVNCLRDITSRTWRSILYHFLTLILTE